MSKNLPQNTHGEISDINMTEDCNKCYLPLLFVAWILKKRSCETPFAKSIVCSGWSFGETETKLLSFSFLRKNSESCCQEFLEAGLEVFKTFKLLEIMQMNWQLFVWIFVCLFFLYGTNLWFFHDLHACLSRNGMDITMVW